MPDGTDSGALRGLLDEGPPLAGALGRCASTTTTTIIIIIIGVSQPATAHQALRSGGGPNKHAWLSLPLLALPPPRVYMIDTLY